MIRRKQMLPPTPGWAVYLRTSTLEAQNPTMSQDRQRFNINRALLEHSDLQVVGEYADVMSGRTPKRDGYQRLLSDARAGKFSHVAVENAERFGRNDTEALITIDELHELGIAIRFADYPDLDPIDADDRLMITISFTLARRESMKLGERVRGGLHAKLRNGGSATIAPDGYINVEEKSENLGRSRTGRYTRWIEPDPEQFKVWRLAWDLLLTDKYTLAEICEELYARGYRYRSGRPFVEIKNGRRKPSINTLSKRFHNWFYAGWVVSEEAGIAPKTIRGQWQPLVTTEEFERGVEILLKRSKHKVPRRKHEYLLSGLIYLEQSDKTLIRMTCSTSNPARNGGGTSHYRIAGADINLMCDDVDKQVAKHIMRIQVDPTSIPTIREAYSEDIAEKLGYIKPNEEKALLASLKAVDEEEARMARLYATKKITDAVWEEWQDRRNSIRVSLEALSQKAQFHISHLDDALAIICKIGVLFKEMDISGQKELLKEIVHRVIVNPEGTITRLELLPPFAYLHCVTQRISGTGSKVSLKTKTSKDTGLCSNEVLLGGPEETRTHDLVSAIDALSQLSYRPP
jgi:DNA invertase Pin-like site-specific DNA recombinase